MTTSPRRPPSALRMPVPRVRCVTTYATKTHDLSTRRVGMPDETIP